MRVILASASPRRRELLAQIGIPFEVQVSHVEENSDAATSEQLVEELSGQKAQAVLQMILGEKGTAVEEKALGLASASGEVSEEKVLEMEAMEGRAVGRDPLLVIGADTVVSIRGQILGKPKDAAEAAQMLELLAGCTHQVCTGVTLLYCGRDGRVARKVFHETTKVDFYPMSKQEIADYVATQDPLDKAGSYGIQGLCARYIRGIQGDYNNVVGLPVGRLYQEAREWLEEEYRSKGRRAVIFDLDGTLSDSIASIKYSCDLAMAPFGYGPYTIEQYKYFVGDGAANLVKRALAAGGDSQLAHFEEAYALYRRIFQENCMYQVKPYQGIRELLACLKEKGVSIAVLSNKPHAETIHVIETLFGERYFDVVQGQQEGMAIKPSPEGVFRILDRLGLRAGEVLYLGDTATDMHTGKGAGAFTVGALWGFRDRKELEEAHADAIIESPMELVGFL